MAKEINKEHTAVESIEEMVKKLQEDKFRILEDFSRAYLAESGLLPSQVELVTKQMPMVDNIIETVIFFRKKENG